MSNNIKNSINNSSFSIDNKIILTKQCFEKIPTRGRPRYKLNDLGLEIIEKLASFMCTEEEIASFMGVSVDTLTREENAFAFAERIKKGQEKGKASLRSSQFRLAKTNPTMAIWLGKQYLGQKDLPDGGNNGFNEDGSVKNANELKIIVEKQVVDLTNKNKGSSTTVEEDADN